MNVLKDNLKNNKKPFGLSCGYFSIHHEEKFFQNNLNINQKCYERLVELGHSPAIITHKDGVTTGTGCDKYYWYCCNHCIGSGNMPNCSECSGPIQLEFDFENKDNN